MTKGFVIILISVLLAGWVLAVAPTQAQEQETTSIGEVSDPGFLPDAPFYFLKSWGRTIRMFFTFDLVKKSQTGT